MRVLGELMFWCEKREGGAGGLGGLESDSTTTTTTIERGFARLRGHAIVPRCSKRVL